MGPTWTSERTCTPTSSCPEVPPCSPVSPIVCRRRSPNSPHPPRRSRSSHHQRGNTPSGSEDPSWPRCPHSTPAGSPKPNTTNAVPPSSTENASRSKPLDNNIDTVLRQDLWAVSSGSIENSKNFCEFFNVLLFLMCIQFAILFWFCGCIL